MQKLSDKDKSQNRSQRQKKVAILINEALVEVLRRGKMLDERLINCPVTKTTIKISDQEAIENLSNLVVTTSADGFEVVTHIGVVKEVKDSEVE